MSGNWTTPRWRRLLMWAMRWEAPSLGYVPTLRQAWTGSAPAYPGIADAFLRGMAEAKAEWKRDLER